MENLSLGLHVAKALRSCSNVTHNSKVVRFHLIYLLMMKEMDGIINSSNFWHNGDQTEQSTRKNQFGLSLISMTQVMEYSLYSVFVPDNTNP